MNLFKQMMSTAAFLCMVTTAHGAVMTVKNQQQFNQHLDTAPIVVVEFFSPTCVHCKQFEQSGAFEQLAQEFPDVKFLKISYGDPEVIKLFSAHKIHGFPTFVFFKDGKEIATHRAAGVLRKEDIKKKIMQMKK
ncbi:MAG: thiol:disulfide interchange protein precursor [Candidatus Dependentiae bacterium ADurb.Bin331]|nr:MAG: thiol:disulfide interchange protein precursor [Candidatus Dependentiae bacterium ADurb.Bin331]